MLPNILLTAIIAGLVVAIIAYIVDFFLGKSGVSFPRQLIWLVALVVWLLWVFGGSVNL